MVIDTGQVETENERKQKNTWNCCLWIVLYYNKFTCSVFKKVWHKNSSSDCDNFCALVCL